MCDPNGYWQRHDKVLLTIEVDYGLVLLSGVVRDNRYVIEEFFHLYGSKCTPNIWIDEDGMVADFDSKEDKMMFYHEEADSATIWCNRVNEDDIPSYMCKDDDVGTIDIPMFDSLGKENA